MRLLIDEDVPIQCFEPLQHLLVAHTVEHVEKLSGWKGKKDRALFADAKTRGVDVLLTNDRSQLNDPAHIKQLKRSGLHHVHYSQRVDRLVGLGLSMGAIVGSMPLIMEELKTATSQRLVAITRLGLTGRYTITDPKTDPPPYWTR